MDQGRGVLRGRVRVAGNKHRNCWCSKAIIYKFSLLPAESRGHPSEPSPGTGSGCDCATCAGRQHSGVAVMVATGEQVTNQLPNDDSFTPGQSAPTAGRARAGARTEPLQGKLQCVELGSRCCALGSVLSIYSKTEGISSPQDPLLSSFYG